MSEWACKFKVWTDEDQEEPEVVVVEFDVEGLPDGIQQASSVPWPVFPSGSSDQEEGA